MATQVIIRSKVVALLHYHNHQNNFATRPFGAKQLCLKFIGRWVNTREYSEFKGDPEILDDGGEIPKSRQKG